VVQFGPKRYYTGIVLRKHEEPPQGDYEIKEITEVLDVSPIVQSTQLKLWQWIADYYMCSIGDVYKAALPSGLKMESETLVELNPTFIAEAPLKEKEQALLDALYINPKQRVQQLLKNTPKSGMHTIKALLDMGAITVDEALRQSYKPKSEVRVRIASDYRSEATLTEVLTTLRRAGKQQELLLKLIDLTQCEAPDYMPRRELSRTQLLKESGMTTAVLNSLINKGIIEIYTVEIGRLTDSNVHHSTHLSPLSEHQQRAYEEITKSWEKHDVCLLHGVTSSGKTEVYIHLIYEQLRQGHQTLFLVPEIALTQQMTERLRRAFGPRLGVYHSKFSDAERVELWKRQLSDTPYDVILGVRSSVFLPFQNLGLVIVDEEHETTYKQQDPAPRYHARSVATMLASYHHGKTLLGTATPSIESYYNAQCDKYGLVQMSERYSQVQLPHIAVVDIKDEQRRKRMYGPFSTLLHDAMRDALNEGKQIILFQNRRGYAPMLECSACGWVPKCDRCDVSLTYHRNMHQLVCHYCGNVYNVPIKCPSCGSHTLSKRGMGTERIEEEVQHYFPTARIARLDLDTTRSKTAYDKIITDFQEGRTNVLIGTQMISKGLDFDNVHVVGIMNADTMLNFPDFRSYERSFQLMAQVAGRAGRRGQQGHVILQTRNIDLPVIHQVVAHDYNALYTDQSAERQLFSYPPYSRLIYLYIKGRDEADVIRASEAMVSAMRTCFAHRVLGPEAPAVARVHALHIRKIMLKVEPSLGVARVRKCLTDIQQSLNSQDLLQKVMIYYDVDPY
jgi:primosomal protein N' (replication factor Y)